MKRFLRWMSFVVMALLVACSLPSTGGTRPPVVESTATLSPGQMQTQISAMLTVMPTTAGEQPAGDASPTPALPTVGVVTATLEGYPPPPAQPTAEATVAPTSAPQAQAPTATAEAPTATVAAQAEAQSPTATQPAGSAAAELSSATEVDHMDDSLGWNWPIGRDRYTRATFANGVQEIVTLSEKDGWRLANPSPTGYGFSNITLEAVFKTGAECAGNGHYGVIVRAPFQHRPDQGYLFGVTCDGRYSLRRWDGDVDPDGEMWDVIHNTKYFFEGSWVESTSINKGPNQVNRLPIDTVNDTFTLYANGTKLADVKVKQARGAYFSAGYFGVFVGPGNMERLRIQLDEMSYWIR
jgi:hypothetical protein